MLFEPIESAADLRRRVIVGETTESKYLEFKTHYDWRAAEETTRSRAADELARDIAQFANAEGGVLLIGVGERSNGSVRVALEGPGVDDAEGLRGWIERALRNRVVPATLSYTIRALEANGKTVVAVNVPASLHLVAVWHRNTHAIEYLYRTNHGKEWMNPDEVESHLMDGSRASRLAVRRVWDETDPPKNSPIVELVPPIEHRQFVASERGIPELAPVLIDHDGAEFRPRLAALREHEVELVIGGARPHVLRVPYTLIRDAWTTVDHKPALALAVRIVSVGKRFHLEPL